MSRLFYLIVAAVVWGAMALFRGESLQPLVGQVIFGATVLVTHWWGTRT